MASTWQNIGQRWLDGEAEKKDVIVEAILEGQVAELEAFLSANAEGKEFEWVPCSVACNKINKQEKS